MFSFIKGFIHWFRNRHYERDWLRGRDWAKKAKRDTDDKKYVKGSDGFRAGARSVLEAGEK